MRTIPPLIFLSLLSACSIADQYSEQVRRADERRALENELLRIEVARARCEAMGDESAECVEQLLEDEPD